MKLFAYSVLVFLVTACSPQNEQWEKPASVVLGCDDYQSIEVESGVLYNNVWNKDAAGGFGWTQCLEQQPDSDSSVFGWSWHWPNRGRQIFAYPQIKVGSSPWDPLPRFDNRFPINLDEIESLIVSHDLTIETNGQHNVATSMWLTNSPDIGDVQNKSVIAAEVMVWTYSTPKHMPPAGRKIGQITNSGQIWSVWLDRNWGDSSGQNTNNWIYLAFRAETPSLSSRFDVVSLFEEELVSNLGLGAYYLADIELGTEIMRGSGLVWVDNFSVEIETVD